MTPDEIKFFGVLYVLGTAIISSAVLLAVDYIKSKREIKRHKCRDYWRR